jgi:hypothetical protein
VEILLRGYKVDIIPEYELYKKPMRIDVVVIKLLEDVVIKNTVMRFFRRHNIVEFKGPTDTLDIESFDKVMSYFYAYLSQRPVKFDEVAITFISTRRPQKLLKVLQSERKYKIIASAQPGIYYITTDAPSLPYVPAMQLVVSNELSAKDAEWIKAIRDDWTVEFGAEVLEKTEKMNDSQLRDVAFSLLWANYHNWKEEIMKLVPSEYFEKWIESTGITERVRQKGRQEGRQEGHQEGRQEGRQEGWQEGIEEERRKNAKAMKDEGIDINTIAKITGMKPASIRRL